MSTTGYRKYSDEELIEQIQMLAQELGKTPSVMEFNLDDRVSSVSTVRKSFGSWNNFVVAAGLPINDRKPNFTDEELINQLKAVVEEMGRVPTYRQFSERPETVSRAAIGKHFGTWNNFIKAAGFKPKNLSYDKISDETLIEQVQGLAIKLGAIPTTTEFNKDPNTASAGTAIIHFGSWNRFLEEAGIIKVQE